jgi:hypothetical protein
MPYRVAVNAIGPADLARPRSAAWQAKGEKQFDAQYPKAYGNAVLMAGTKAIASRQMKSRPR